MPTIIDYIPSSAAFTPEELAIMGEAYDRAIRSFDSRPSRTVREVIASKIISLAKQGHRDPIKLCQEALAAFGIHSDCN